MQTIAALGVLLLILLMAAYWNKNMENFTSKENKAQSIYDLSNGITIPGVSAVSYENYRKYINDGDIIEYNDLRSLGTGKPTMQQIMGIL